MTNSKKLRRLAMGAAERDLQRGKRLANPVLQHRRYHVLRAEVVAVDQVDAQALRLQKLVVLHVRRHVGIASRRRGKADLSAAGAPAYGQLVHRPDGRHESAGRWRKGPS